MMPGIVASPGMVTTWMLVGQGGLLITLTPAGNLQVSDSDSPLEACTELGSL